ncbi:MAG: hypothetical protein JSU74_06385 [Candidatus Zixiibacteriota bacterium]|nr:MAG: hypothetical protein JSU74_06385 [candidate division Zixibacteria bacterium]
MPNIKEFLFSVDYGLGKSIGFHENLETWIKAELDKSLVDDAGRKVAENQVDIRVLLSSKYGDLKQTYPRLARQSLFLYIYGLVEYSLNELCDIIQREMGLALSHKDLKDKGLQRVSLYLKKVARKRLPGFLKEKNELGLLNFVRNQLIHNDGVLNSDRKNEFKDKLKNAPSFKGISLCDATSRISLEQEFVEGTVIRFRKMFMELGEILDARFKPFDAKTEGTS